MKKVLGSLAIAAIAVLGFGFAGWAYAQSPTDGPYGGGMMGGQAGDHGMYDQGMMGSYGGMMGDHGMSGQGMLGGYGGMMGDHDGMEALHEYMLPAMASALGLTPENFEARLEAGESFWDIAEVQGLTQEDAWSLMQDARTAALQQAVEDGAIDPDFAAWMLEHADQMHGADGFGAGGHCGEGETLMRSGNDL